MTRRIFIERSLRQIYGGFWTDDAQITVNLVNKWLDAAIGVAAKANYTDSLKLDGVAYINSSFYTTFKDLAIVEDERFTWKVTLPQLPFGLGASEGISTVKVKDGTNDISRPVIFITHSQRGFYDNMRQIPGKVLAYSEGEFVYIISTLVMSQYTAHVTMVSGGTDTNLDSTLNVPSDYHPIMIDYIKQQLLFERQMPVDTQNDGVDAIKTV